MSDKQLSSSVVEFEDVGLTWNGVGSFSRGGSKTGGRHLDRHSDKEKQDEQDDELELLKKMGLPSAFGKATRHEGPKETRKKEPVDYEGMQCGVEDDLRDEWQQRFDEATGSYYYYNEKLQESQWERPSCGFKALPGGHLLTKFDEIDLEKGSKGNSAGKAQSDGKNRAMPISQVLGSRSVEVNGSKRNGKVSLLGNVLVKPRMETSGIMDEILLPHGIHTRFEQEEKEDLGSAISLENDVELDQTVPAAVIAKLEQAATRTPLKKQRRNRRQRVKYQKEECNKHDVGDFVQINPLKKYWLQRYSLFSQFDKGVILDDESWYSVTPEIIAWHQATRIARYYGSKCLVVDAFGGAGGNTIQFALAGLQVISIDISKNKAFIIRQNATVYGVLQSIDILCGDFTVVSSSIHADVLFLSPPWGGPEYSQNDIFDVEAMGGNPHLGLGRLLHIACVHIKASSVVVWLPRNTNMDQVTSVIRASPMHSSAAHVEEARVNGVSKGLTVYIGLLAEYISKSNP